MSLSIRAVRPLARAFLRLLALCNLPGPLIPLYDRALRRAAADAPAGDRVTLLALNPARFRGELELLEGTGRFRILRMPWPWQTRLIEIFYGSDPRADAIFDPIADAAYAEAQRRYRAFLRRLLAPILRRQHVACVIGAAVHYRQDVDWAAAARACGVPYVVFHRESLVPSPGVRRVAGAWYARMGRFQGDHLVVHNEAMREIFIESGFARPDQVSALGVMRMDPFLERIRGRSAPRDQRRLALFSFFHAAGLGQERNRPGYDFDGAWAADGRSGFVRLFDEVHGAVARLAAERPDVEVCVKTKWGDADWQQRVRRAAAHAGVDVDALPNFRIDAGWDAHELILQSDVVTGFGSTTLLEAAVAGRPVLLPLFAEAAEPHLADFVPFAHETAVFDQAHDLATYERLLRARLADPTVPADVQARRDAAFSRYVSDAQGGACDRHVALIERVIREGVRS